MARAIEEVDARNAVQDWERAHKCNLAILNGQPNAKNQAAASWSLTQLQDAQKRLREIREARREPVLTGA